MGRLNPHCSSAHHRSTAGHWPDKCLVLLPYRVCVTMKHVPGFAQGEPLENLCKCSVAGGVGKGLILCSTHIHVHTRTHMYCIWHMVLDSFMHGCQTTQCCCHSNGQRHPWQPCTLAEKSSNELMDTPTHTTLHVLCDHTTPHA